LFLQGVVPLGGCKVEKVERGPKGSKFGLKITHPDFYAGRQLILAADKEDDQEAWLKAINDCSRVYVALVALIYSFVPTMVLQYDGERVAG
jgi:hypothetical protein